MCPQKKRRNSTSNLESSKVHLQLLYWKVLAVKRKRRRNPYFSILYSFLFHSLFFNSLPLHSALYSLIHKRYDACTNVMAERSQRKENVDIEVFLLISYSSLSSSSSSSSFCFLFVVSFWPELSLKKRRVVLNAPINSHFVSALLIHSTLSTLHQPPAHQPSSNQTIPDQARPAIELWIENSKEKEEFRSSSNHESLLAKTLFFFYVFDFSFYFLVGKCNPSNTATHTATSSHLLISHPQEQQEDRKEERKGVRENERNPQEPKLKPTCLIFPLLPLSEFLYSICV